MRGTPRRSLSYFLVGWYSSVNSIQGVKGLRDKGCASTAESIREKGLFWYDCEANVETRGMERERESTRETLNPQIVNSREMQPGKRIWEGTNVLAENFTSWWNFRLTDVKIDKKKNKKIYFPFLHRNLNILTILEFRLNRKSISFSILKSSFRF